MDKKFRRITQFWKIFSLILLYCFGASGLSGCATPVKASYELRVSSANDLLPIINSIRDEYEKDTNLKISIVDSTDRINDLKAGKIDAVLLGREPTLGDLAGLDSAVIAYDAVCITIKTSTFNGGVIHSYNPSAKNSMGQPLKKYEGLQDFSLEDLRGLMGVTVGVPNSIWELHGTKAGVLVFEPILDENRNQVPDPDTPGYFQGNWVWTYVSGLAFQTLYQPGKFDTQAALAQKLVLPEPAGSTNQIMFSHLTSEELYVSQFYNLDPSEEKPDKSLTYDFSFGLNILSRRIVMSALEHKFQIRALSINGIDPIKDPNLIYSETYPLSRKIYVLIKNPWVHVGKAFSDYLKSPPAQEKIKSLNFLPLRDGQ